MDWYVQISSEEELYTKSNGSGDTNATFMKNGGCSPTNIR